MLVNVNPSSVRKIEVVPDSRLIDKMSYDSSEMTLEVLYKSGDRKGQLRTYEQIAFDQFFNLLNSDSVGKALLKLVHRSREQAA